VIEPATNPSAAATSSAASSTAGPPNSGQADGELDATEKNARVVRGAIDHLEAVIAACEDAIKRGMDATQIESVKQEARDVRSQLLLSMNSAAFLGPQGNSTPSALCRNSPSQNLFCACGARLRQDHNACALAASQRVRCSNLPP
jgi:hypothetical protein